MKAVTLKYRTLLTFTLPLFFLLLSCSDDDDAAQPENKLKVDKVSVYLDFNFEVTGDVLMTLRDKQTNQVIGTSAASIAGFTDANDGWIDFNFSPSAEVVNGTTCQIELKRSVANVPYHDVALWRSGVGDVYAHGGSSAVGSSNVPNGDFAFKTFLAGVADQKQESKEEVSILSNNSTLIQEFVSGK